ncbi:MAG: copper amine oxidase N-terminal domain-containing protein, partial [Bacillota bacterium]
MRSPLRIHRLGLAVLVAFVLALGLVLEAPTTVSAEPQIRLFVNGQEIRPEVPAQIVGGRVMVPARYIAEPLGAEVAWDGAAQAVVITSSAAGAGGAGGAAPTALPPAVPPGIRIFIDGQEVHPDVPAQAIGGHVMVPARFVAEPLGATVRWDGEGPSVIVTKREPPALTSSDLTKPFNPTDVFFFSLPDFNDLSVAQRAHATVIGSSRQPQDWRLEDYFEHADLVRGIVDPLHQAGLQYVSPITNDYPAIYGYTGPSDTACIDIDGQVIYQPMLPAGRPYRSMLHPDWQKYIIESAKKAVDAGVDVIPIDTWTLQYDVTNPPFNGDFSVYSLRGFREYLGRKYSAAELRGFGVADFSTFDYGDFIRRGYRALYDSNRLAVPLFRDFLDFQMQASLDFWGGLIKEVKAYAAAKGKTVSFMVNVPEWDNAGHRGTIHGLPLIDVV